MTGERSGIGVGERTTRTRAEIAQAAAVAALEGSFMAVLLPPVAVVAEPVPQTTPHEVVTKV